MKGERGIISKAEKNYHSAVSAFFAILCISFMLTPALAGGEATRLSS